MNKTIWEKDKYYEAIQETHRDGLVVDDPILLRFAKLLSTHKCESIIDVGCGEGWLIGQLSKVLNKDSKFFGIDVSSSGLAMAKQRNINNAEFLKYNGEAFPFFEESFEAAISSFVFEHLTDPEKIFNEMSRVVKRGGLIIIACPNFGSPLFSSPCNKRNHLVLMLERFKNEFGTNKIYKQVFNWDHVQPIFLPPDKHIADFDTLSEPSLSFFDKFLKNNRDKYSLVEISSLWDAYDYKDISASENPSLLKKVLVAFAKFLGMNKILRFQYFGSFFFVAIKKL